VNTLSQTELDHLLETVAAHRPLALSGYALAGLTFDHQDFSEADLSGSDLSRASLQGTNLTRANLAGCQLPFANLTGACCAGANLSHCNLREATLFRTDLAHANLEGAVLSEAYVEQVTVTHVRAVGCRVGGSHWKYETLVEWMNQGAIPVGWPAPVPVALDADAYRRSENDPGYSAPGAPEPPPLPERAPERYADRQRGESAVQFLERVWGRYLTRFGAARDGLFQDQLWKLDPTFRAGLQTYCRYRHESMAAYVPPKSIRTRAERRKLLIDWTEREPTRLEVRNTLRILSSIYHDLLIAGRER
jgi:hypothetical protein